MSQKRARSPQEEPQFYRSEEIRDRGSVFVAVFSAKQSARELQKLEELKSASHRIIAWRKESAQKTLLASAPQTYDVGFDDDGEKYAGKKLAKVLEDQNVAGSIVVGRWFGGTLLGPARFSHIESCAREAVARYKTNVRDEPAKKRKVEEEEAERDRLRRELPKRDANIAVLRELLQQKRAEASGDGLESSKPSAETAAPTAKTKVDYGKLALPALRSLEKARDATIAFVLKEITKAEEAVEQPAELSRSENSSHD